jgi:hypothetical protein
MYFCDFPLDGKFGKLVFVRMECRVNVCSNFRAGIQIYSVRELRHTAIEVWYVAWEHTNNLSRINMAFLIVFFLNSGNYTKAIEVLSKALQSQHGIHYKDIPTCSENLIVQVLDSALDHAKVRLEFAEIPLLRFCLLVCLLLTTNIGSHSGIY